MNGMGGEGGVFEEEEGGKGKKTERERKKTEREGKEEDRDCEKEENREREKVIRQRAGARESEVTHGDRAEDKKTLLSADGPQKKDWDE